MIDKTNIKDIYSLSPMQEGMLFYYVYDNQTTSYIEQFDFTLEGSIDASKFEEAFNSLISKYDIFRTIFVYRKSEKPRQVVLKERFAKVHFEDISSKSFDEQQEHLKLFKIQERQTGFDLSKDILLKCSLVDLGKNQIKIIFTFHHILMDGWCLGIVFNDLFGIYGLLLNNQNDLVGKQLQTKFPYSDFIKWYEKQDLHQAKEYFSNYLDAYGQTATMQLHPNTIGYESGLLKFELGQSLSQEISKLANELNVTVNNIFQISWGILLQRYNNTDDVVFGSVVSGRPANLPGAQEMIGLFINTLPVRIKSDGNDSPASVAKSVQQQTRELMQYEYVPLSEIQSQSELKNGLFDHILAFENYPISEEMKGLDLKERLKFTVKEVDVHEQTNYNLNVIILPNNNFSVHFNYNTKCFSESFLQKVAGQLIHIISQIVNSPNTAIKEIQIITEDEKSIIINKFNNTQQAFPKDKNITELFEEQVARFPLKEALNYNNTTYNFEQLNQKANNIANYLKDQGIGLEDKVALLSARCDEFIIGVLGILKTGATYVPVDPKFPVQRINFMINDSKSKIVLVQNDIPVEILHQVENTVTIGSILQSNQNNKNLALNISSSSGAYIMYTSGSTGNPKGVLVEHINVTRLVKNSTIIEYEKDHRFLLTGATVFDATTFEIWGSLLNGNTLCIVDELTILNAISLQKVIIDQKISVMWLTASLFNQLSDENTEMFNTLDYLLVGGDVLSPVHINKVRKQNNTLKIINGYGPTENTTFSTTFQINKDYDKNVPIGKPITNSTAYVFDKYHNLQPIGVAGELYVGGYGVARGYVNNDELTNERFIENPFEINGRLYKTGDLVRWLPEGNIEFIGRKDFQIKIRGFRIELAEIESIIKQYDGVKNAVVIAKSDNGNSKYLCAYIVVKEKEDNIIEKIRTYLNDTLPDYMVPAYLILMDQLPLNNNGKVDLKALPEPHLSIASKSIVPPSNKVEQELVVIWKKVLSLEDTEIGIENDFFELGGQSIKAMKLAAEIRVKLDFEIPLAVIFERTSIKKMAEYFQNKNHSEPVEKIPPLEKVAEKEYYLVSSAQKRVYTISKFSPDSTAYNMPGIYDLEGDLNIDHLENCILQMINRHEALRTSFEMRDNNPVQIINDKINWSIVRKNVDILDENIKSEIIKEFVQPYDLATSPLIRVTVVTKNKTNQYFLLFDMHHIISDGVSMDIFITEISMLYAGKKLPDVKFQYKDFVAWQNNLLQSGKFEAQKQFWIEKLSGEIPVLEFPVDHIRPSIQEFDGDRYSFTINEELALNLKNYASKKNVTLQILLLTAYYIFLLKYTRQKDIIVGAPIAGRKDVDLNSIFGMFVNTLALRNYPDPEKTLLQFIEEVKKNSIEAYDNQDFQFESLIDLLDVKRDTSRNALFDTMFVLQNPEIREGGLQLLNMKQYPYKNQTSKFDLFFEGWQDKDIIKFDIEYNTHLFETDTIQRLSEHFLNLLENIVKSPDALKIKHIDMISAIEQQIIIHDFNQTKSDYPSSSTIIQLFKEQVNLKPNAMATVFAGKGLTYSELDKKTNQIANMLIEKQIKHGDMVALAIDRCNEMVVATIGILKAGAVYVPIDPEYPEKRINFILDDIDAKLILTTEAFKSGLNFNGEIMTIDVDALSSTVELVKDAEAGPESIAYIMYTSGSTGNPKGVLVKHKNVVRLVKNNNFLNVEPNDRILQTGSPVFDATTFELWGGLLNGGTVYLIGDKTILDAEELKNEIIKNNITIMWVTSPLFNQLTDQDPLLFSTLRAIMVGGDALSPKHINKVRSFNKNLIIINGYGPTENTTFSTTFTIDKDYSKSIPIGKPINNSTAYILDNSFKLQPIGVPGELFVGGDGVAKGYLNNEELTKQKFIDNPFTPGAKLYRTGDMARWLPNGNIEFLGRNDFQIKIRGFRIEPGEIENTIQLHDEIKETIVLVKKKSISEKYIIAYYVTKNNSELSSSELRKFLKGKIPDYMVPAYLVQLDKLPLNQNGKIDRRKLPEPQITSNNYEAPRNDIESIMVKSWADVLGITGEKSLGINDNFFEIGGDSIKAMQISSVLQKENLKINLRDLFQYQTIAELSSFAQLTSGSISEQIAVEGEIPLAPIQNWYFQNKYQYAKNFVQRSLLSCNEPIKPELLEKVLGKIIEHHDALRIIFTVGQSVSQVNRPLQGDFFTLRMIDLTNEQNVQQKIETHIKQLEETVCPESELIKACIFQTKEMDQLYIGIHHLIVDAVSWGILIEDLTIGYSQVLKGEEIHFQQKTSSYKNWAEGLVSATESKSFKDEIAYWKNISESKDRFINLNEDYVPQGTKREKMSFELDNDLTSKLIKQSNKAYNTEISDILIAALGLSLSFLDTDEKIPVFLENHGREEIYNDLDVSRTVGWFTNMFPVFLNTKSNGEIGGYILETKNALRKIPSKGMGYGIFSYLTDHGTQTLKPEISFNYLGEIDKPASKNGVFSLSPLFASLNIEGGHEYVCPIDFVAYISGGVFKLMVTYDTAFLDTSKIGTLINNYNQSINRLIEHCSHRIEEISRKDFQDFDLLLNKHLADIEIVQDSYAKSILTSEVVNEYPLTATQMSNFSIKFDPVLITMPFKKEINIEFFEKALKEVIKDQGLLRSKLLHKDNLVYWQEYNTPIHLDLSYVNLSDYGDSLRNKLLQEIINKKYQTNFIEQQSLMYNLVFIKLNDNSFILFFFMDHLIVDVMSTNIIKNNLLQYYSIIEKGMEINKKPIVPYSQYVKQINKIPTEISANDLIEEYQLIDYYHYSSEIEKQLLEKDTGKTECLIKYEVNLGEEIDEVKAWDFSLIFYSKFLQQFLNVKKVPIALISFGRRYGNNTFFETVGEFVDLIPLLIEVDNQNPMKMVEISRNRVNRASKNSINFINLLNLPKDDDWTQAAGMYVPKMHEGVMLNASLNFHGKFEEEELKLSHDFVFSASDANQGMNAYSSISCIVDYTPKAIYFTFFTKVESDMGKFKKMLDEVKENVTEIMAIEA